MQLTKMGNSILPKRKEDEEAFNISIKMNGTGNVDFEIKPES